MTKTGIFSGTVSVTMRQMAKKMVCQSGDMVSKPLDVNRIEVSRMLQYAALILASLSSVKDGRWQAFLPPRLKGRHNWKTRRHLCSGQSVGTGITERHDARTITGCLTKTNINTTKELLCISP